jgi:acetyltransferase-like isoleucine patch superfamily enzyme
MQRSPRPPTHHGAKRVVFAVAYALCCLIVAPLVLLCHLHRRLVRDFDYLDYGNLLGLAPTALGRILRHAFYRHTLRRCGHSVEMGFGSYFVYPDTEIGDCFYCGAYCIIGKCRMGDNVMVSSRVSILSGRHQHGSDTPDLPMRLQPGERRAIDIGSDVWIGEGAIVAADVGDHAIVGAGAVVVNPIPAGAVAVGNPARVVRIRPAVEHAQETEAGFAQKRGLSPSI